MPEEIKPDKVSETITDGPVLDNEQSLRTKEASRSSSTSKQSFKAKLKAIWTTKKGKALYISCGVLLAVAGMFAYPTTRYAIAGVVIKKDVTLTVLDEATRKPVSGAMVRMGSYRAISDAKGTAQLSRVPVGEYTVTTEKKYYSSLSSTYTVPITNKPPDSTPSLKPTGRAIELNVTNRLTGAALAGATITISGSSVSTDEKGIATITLPIKTGKQEGEVKANGYITSPVSIAVTGRDNQKEAVAVTPAGSVYFLSKRTGTMNVMKSNLDGTDQKLVVSGTGEESNTNTVMLATTDWKYLALHATRDSEDARLYLIDTTTQELSVIDEGGATFQLVGWSGHNFIYLVNRNGDPWMDKRQVLKSYDAQTKAMTTLDETTGNGSSYYVSLYEDIANMYIVDKAVVYTKTWNVGPFMHHEDKQSAIMKVNTDGKGKTRLKEFAASTTGYFDSKPYAVNEIYIRVIPRETGKPSFYEYENGKVSATNDINDQKYLNSYYATYLHSPSGEKTMWYEPRDGKNVIFVGDSKGKNGREVGVSDFVPYGWLSDEYILFSQKGSELFSFSTKGTFSEMKQPVKISDYHKPQLTYYGYGSGYGGL